MNAISTTDFYKVDHINQYPLGTNKIYSNFTPRSSRLFNKSSLYDNKVVVFGIQRVVMDYLIDFWNETFFNLSKEEAINKYSSLMKNTIGKVSVKQFEALHDLGYLPLHLKALPEGTRSPIKVPVFTITSTHDDFFWLVNYIESALSTESWKVITMATTAFEFRRVFENYATLTGSDKSFIPFQGHDFSMRGLACRHEAFTNSIAHLTSFVGTDTILSIEGAIKYYGAKLDKELIGTSVYASEHSTITMQINNYISRRQKPICEISSNLPETNNWDNTDFDKDIKDCLYDNIKFIHTPDGLYYEIIDMNKVERVTKEFAENNSKLTFDDLESKHIAELQVLKYMLTEVYPSGIYSHVSDSYDYWHLLGTTLPKLKDIILNRQEDDFGLAKLTIRPDSGTPEKIICGLNIKDLNFNISDISDMEKNCRSMSDIVNYANNTINTSYYDGFYYDGQSYNWKGEKILDIEILGSLETLWKTFGGTTNDKGFKILNPRVGLIYGDSITIERQENILERMMEMGYASSNIVFGIGSFSYQYTTRDSLGFAMKSTYGKVDNKGIEIFKDPMTDSGTKKSARGLLRVDEDENGNIILIDQVTIEEEKGGMLQTVFKNGKMYNTCTLQDIRNRLHNEFKDL